MSHHPHAKRACALLLFLVTPPPVSKAHVSVPGTDHLLAHCHTITPTQPLAPSPPSQDAEAQWGFKVKGLEVELSSALAQVSESSEGQVELQGKLADANAARKEADTASGKAAAEKLKSFEVGSQGRM